MTRLDEIKSWLEQRRAIGFTGGGVTGDVEYLIERLERAEAALRAIESGAVYFDGKPGKTPKTRARAYFEGEKK